MKKIAMTRKYEKMPILSSKTIQEVAGVIDVEYNSNKGDFAAPESDCNNHEECVSEKLSK